MNYDNYFLIMSLSYKNFYEDPFVVLRSTAEVVLNSKYVAINEGGLNQIAGVVDEKIKLGLESAESSFWSLRNLKDDIQLVFFEDVINFSFWSDTGVSRWKIIYPAGAEPSGGWYSLVAGFRRVIEKGVLMLNANFMAGLTVKECQEIFMGEGAVNIPMAEARQKNLNEAGKVLRDKFGGEFLAVLENADYDAIKLVKLLYDKFSSFRDEAVCNGKKVFFLKRAQICASDISYVLEKYEKSPMKNLGALTAFADYRLLQILRHFVAMRYSGELAQKVDGCIQIIAGSCEELEIGAATIWCVEFIRQRLKIYNAAQIDNALWLISQNQVGMKPYHRTRTIFY